MPRDTAAPPSPSFDDVADIIVNKTPTYGSSAKPVRELGAKLNRLAVRLTIMRDADKIPAAKARKRLKSYLDAAEELGKLDDDPGVLRLLGDLGGEGCARSIPATMRHLHELQQSMEHTEAELAGRRRPWEAARRECAIIVRVAWRLVHEKYPGHDNPTAASAAYRYWRAAGGRVAGGGVTEGKHGWIKHFKEVKRAAYAGRHEAIRRLLDPRPKPRAVLNYRQSC